MSVYVCVLHCVLSASLLSKRNSQCYLLNRGHVNEKEIITKNNNNNTVKGNLETGCVKCAVGNVETVCLACLMMLRE